jgi:peptidoglycan/xylan/chitin deacetylase (PgdA/CDA1 family)
MPELTAVTYHYVHDTERADFPRLKALDVRRFDEQLSFFADRFQFVDAAAIAARLGGRAALPERAMALTFDDGFRDHYSVVFPRLLARKIQGLFYVPRSVLLQTRVLRVHKLQLVLAALDTTELLVRARKALEERGISVDRARESYVHRSRWDDPATGFVKWLLSSHLDVGTSEQVIAELFAGVYPDEPAVARKLYLSLDEAREMAGAGMHLGGHGDGHYRLDEAPNELVEAELEASRRMVAEIDAEGTRSFAYPYGTFRPETAQRIEQLGFDFAWTTNTGADIGEPGARMRLARRDTNDFPPSVAG